MKSLFDFFRNKKWIYIIPLLVFLGCSAERNTAVSRFYHNTTAYYNPLFIIKKDHKEIEKNLWTEENLNFNRILPLYTNYDSTKIESDKKILDKDIKLASKAIDWHKNSKWVDDGYIKLGQTFFYLRKFEKAASSYKIAFRKTENPDIKAQALIYAIHNFVDSHQYDKAKDAINLIEKGGTLKSELQKVFLLKKALYYQRIDDKKNMLNTLLELDALKSNKLRKRDRKNYIYFIIGQLAEYHGDLPLASLYYNKTIKSNPSYLIDFHAKIRYYQVSKDVKQKTVEKMEKYFKKMIRDEKNKEYRDNIYHEWGLFKYKFDTPQSALYRLKKGLEVKSSSELQKTLTFLKIAEIYYDDIENYRFSSRYYDSTMTVMPKNFERYEEIKKKTEILKEFSKEYEIVKEKDSLIYLSTLSETEVKNIIDKVADSLILNLKKQKRLAKKREESNNDSSGIYDKDSDGYFVQDNIVNPKAQFYFYNLELVEKGKNEFLQRWGERELKDNWRRSSALDLSPQTNQDDTNTTKEVENVENSQPKQKEKKSKKKKNEQTKQEIVDEMLTKIPRSESMIKELENAIEKAMLNMAKIYAYKLFETQKAIETLKSKINRYEESETRPEALYILFLLHKADPNTSREAEDVKGYLLKNYPDNIYSKLAINPSYREDKALQNEKARKEYERIYDMYKNKQYKSVKQAVAQAKVTYSQTDYIDNFDLLKVLLLPIEGKEDEYVSSLNYFSEQYPKSELLDYVKKLTEHKTIFEEDMEKAIVGIYKRKFDTTHHFVITYPKKMLPIDSIAMKTNQFIRNNFPNRKTLLANAKSLNDMDMIDVKGLKDRNDAKIFFISLNNNFPFKKESEHENFNLFDYFVITDENLKILEKEAAYTDYLDFFDEYYSDFIVSKNKNN